MIYFTFLRVNVNWLYLHVYDCVSLVLHKVLVLHNDMKVTPYYLLCNLILHEILLRDLDVHYVF